MNRRSLILLILVSAVLISLAGFVLFQAPATVRPPEAARLGIRSGPTSPQLTAYRIRAGRHFCTPRIFRMRRRPERVSWLVQFAEDCAYNLGDEDQKDWNKLLGLFYHFFNPLENTVMVGWRYNLETGRMELNAYYHLDGKRDFSRPLLDVPLGEPVRADILVDYHAKTYTVQLERLADGYRVSDSRTFSHDRTACLEINTYFGGNETAPQDLTVRKGYIQE